MKRLMAFRLLLCLLTFHLNAQTKENADTNQLLIGQWSYVKTLDASSNEVKYVTKDNKEPDANDRRIFDFATEITIKDNNTYVKKFKNGDTDTGNWRLITTDGVAFEKVVPKDSKQGYEIKQKQEILGKAWKTDAKGNYLDTSITTVVLLTATEMRIVNDKKQVFVYKKN